MIGDYPNLPEANNQPIPQQPLILPGYAENTPEPFPNAQPTTINALPLLDMHMQRTFAQQPFLDIEPPFPDMQDLSAQAYHTQFGYPYADPVRPEYQTYDQPSSPFTKLINLWRSDPAYKVFFIALATVLISSVVCMLLISNLFKQPSPSQMPTADKTTQMSAPTPVNIPTPMAIPTPLPTPTVEPTTPPAPSQLTVDITSISSTVTNNTTTSLGVTTNEPGVHVAFYVTYRGASPSSFQGASATTNTNGQVTLLWPVRVHPTKKLSNVTAHVTVFAQDTNGQTATSQTVTVQVLTFQVG
jgi:hypothetical protein